MGSLEHTLFSFDFGSKILLLALWASSTPLASMPLKHVKIYVLLNFRLICRAMGFIMTSSYISVIVLCPHHGWFHFLAAVNRAATKVDVQVSLRCVDTESFRYMLKSARAGSLGRSSFCVLKGLLISIAGAAVHTPTSSGRGFLFPHSLATICCHFFVVIIVILTWGGGERLSKQFTFAFP